MKEIIIVIVLLYGSVLLDYAQLPKLCYQVIQELDVNLMFLCIMLVCILLYEKLDNIKHKIDKMDKS